MMKRFFSVLLLLVFSANLYAAANATPKIYLFLESGPAKNYLSYLKNPNIQGAQIIYSWKTLEPHKGVYNFAPIQADLQLLSSLHKTLFIQIQDRSFNAKIIPVPHYLLSKSYQGGVEAQIDYPGEGVAQGAGWVAKQWIPSVRTRFQQLLMALGKTFDGKIQGINLPETAFDPNKKSADFSCDSYFASVIANMQVLRHAFKQSDVVQYVNFFPCEWNNDHHYMSRLFKFAKQNHIGLGGPDVVPYRRGQMKNSYPFFNRYKGQLPVVALAVQEPDYTYIDPATKKHFTIRQIVSFATTYLGATILFWNIQEPQYSHLVLPFFQQST